MPKTPEDFVFFLERAKITLGTIKRRDEEFSEEMSFRKKERSLTCSYARRYVTFAAKNAKTRADLDQVAGVRSALSKLCKSSSARGS